MIYDINDCWSFIKLDIKKKRIIIMAIIQVGLREQIELEYWVLFCE